MTSLLDIAISVDPEAPWHALFGDYAPPERAIRGFDGLRFWRACAIAARMTGTRFPDQADETMPGQRYHGPRFPCSRAWR